MRSITFARHLPANCHAQILGFFAHMGMPHSYKAPLLLVEGHVLDEYAHKEGRRQDAEHAPMFSVRGLCVAHVYT
jgi:hypothetical protein